MSSTYPTTKSKVTADVSPFILTISTLKMDTQKILIIFWVKFDIITILKVVKDFIYHLLFAIRHDFKPK